MRIVEIYLSEEAHVRDDESIPDVITFIEVENCLFDGDLKNHNEVCTEIRFIDRKNFQNILRRQICLILIKIKLIKSSQKRSRFDQNWDTKQFVI